MAMANFIFGSYTPDCIAIVSHSGYSVCVGVHDCLGVGVGVPRYNVHNVYYHPDYHTMMVVLVNMR